LATAADHIFVQTARGYGAAGSALTNFLHLSDISRLGQEICWFFECYRYEQLFLGSALSGGIGVYMYRVPALAVLLAAATFQPNLAGQMRAMPHSSGRVQINFSRFRVPPPGRFGVMSPRPFGRRALFAGPVAPRHNLRFNVLFGNSCFTSPFFDPFFCQQLFFRNRFLFAQTALPYPYFRSDYGYDSEEAAQPQGAAVPASAPVQAPAAPLEPLLIERQGDHLVRMTLSQKALAGGQSAPDYSEKSTLRSSSPARKIAVQPPRELPPAVLVFRDGRREEVSSYTMMNGIIYSKADYWSTGSWTRKIQIADLDVPATLKLNQERGLKFVLPAGPNVVVMRP
jgi:hypothetical protein